MALRMVSFKDTEWFMHLAGLKIRQWRESRNPPLSAEEFGEKFGDPWPSRTVYGWEAKGKIARAPVQKRLAEMGICSLEDWLEPAPQEGAAPVDKSSHANLVSPSRGTGSHPFYDM